MFHLKIITNKSKDNKIDDNYNIGENFERKP